LPEFCSILLLDDTVLLLLWSFLKSLEGVKAAQWYHNSPLREPEKGRVSED